MSKNIYNSMKYKGGNMEKLKELQKKSNKTIQENAQNLGLPFSTYNNYLVGTREPKIELLIKMANYFGCSVDELVGNEKKTSFTTSPTKQRALDIFNQLADNDYLVLIGYMEHLLLEKEQKRKQRINTIIEDINRGE